MFPIETDRLTLRRFAPDDANMLVSLFADERVAKWVGDGSALPLNEAQRWIEISHRSEEMNGTSAGAIIEQKSGKLIGWGGIVHPPAAEPELLYGFEVTAWGKGYGFEMAHAIVQDALAHKRVESLIATVDPENSASIKILKRLGFMLIDSGLDEFGLPTDTYRMTI